MKIIFLLIMLTTFSQGKAQNLPIRLIIGSESTAIPFTRFLASPIHPVLQIGTEFNYKASSENYLYQTLNIGYTYHEYLYQGVLVNTEFGYDYKLKWGINVKALVGIGYMHTFTVQEEYQFKNGNYDIKPDKGNSRFIPSLSLGIGYRIHKNKLMSPEIFVLYQSWIEYPYSPGFIPIMSHVNFNLGTKFFIGNKKISAQ